MRQHEKWCQARYRDSESGIWGVCDCGAEQENAAQLAPQTTGLKKQRHKGKTSWAGNLPDQFCVKCESFPVKAVIITPREASKPTRVFAACLTLECAHIRELDISVV